MSELQEADLKLRAISRERQMRLAYIQRMKAEHDQVNFREGYLREGFEKGLEKGLEKGREEGLEKGLEEGREEGQLAMLEQLHGAGILSREEYQRQVAELDAGKGGAPIPGQAPNR